MPWPSVCLAGYRMRRGQQLRGREWNGAAEQRLWGAWHGEGVGSGSALAEVTQWHQRKDNAVAEGGWTLASCKPPPSLAREGRAAEIRPRGDSTG